MGAMLLLPPALNLKGIDATLTVKVAISVVVVASAGHEIILAAHLSIRNLGPCLPRLWRHALLVLSITPCLPWLSAAWSSRQLLNSPAAVLFILMMLVLILKSRIW